MLSFYETKYCLDPKNIENRDKALMDGTECWKLVHRNFFTKLGIVSTPTLKSLNLFWNRPSTELIYMKREDYEKMLELHSRQVPKTNNKVVWKFWIMLNPTKLLSSCSPEEYHHLATLTTTLRNRIKALQWLTNNNKHYPFKIHKPWIEDHDQFVAWALKNGFNNPDLVIKRIDKHKDFEPGNLKMVEVE